MNPDLFRISQIPFYQISDVDLTEYFLKTNGVGHLRSVQSKSLLQAWAAGGLLGAIGVGSGKTLLWALLPHLFGAQKPLVLIPASLRIQVEEMLREYQRDWKICRFPLIMSYSRLSMLDGEKHLNTYCPDLIIADEAHYLRDLDSARTQRISRFLQKYSKTRFVALSGTITKRSIYDYAHLAEWALRGNNPLPRDKFVLAALSRIIDPEETPLDTDWALIKQLYPYDRVEAVREAYRKRLYSTLGIVISGNDGDCDSSILITCDHAVTLSTDIHSLIEVSNIKECDKEGLFFASDIEKWRYQFQLSLGWYYKSCQFNREWLEIRNNWYRECRAEIKRSGRAGYDTPALIEQSIQMGNSVIPYSLKIAWEKWITIKDTAKAPVIIPQWLDRTSIKYLIDQYGEESTIFWYHHTAVANFLREIRGIDVVSPGGKPPLHGKGMTALSISSHMQGWNLQNYRKSVVLEPPANGQAWEQIIGRTHRRGQQADTVEIVIPQHTQVFRNALQKAKRDAKYIQQTEGLKHKFSISDWASVKKGE